MLPPRPQEGWQPVKASIGTGMRLNEGEEGEGPTIGEKKHIIHFNNLLPASPCWFHELFSSLSNLEWPQKLHSLNQCWHGCGFPCHARVPYFFVLSSPNILNPSVFAESRGLNIYVELHNSRISAVAQQDRLYGTGWSSTCRNKPEWHPPPPPEWDPRRVWWAAGVTCSAVTSLPKK